MLFSTRNLYRIADTNVHYKIANVDVGQVPLKKEGPKTNHFPQPNVCDFVKEIPTGMQNHNSHQEFQAAIGIFHGKKSMCSSTPATSTTVTIAACADGKSVARTGHRDSKGPRNKAGTPYHQRSMRKREMRKVKARIRWGQMRLQRGIFHAAQPQIPTKVTTTKVSNAAPVSNITRCSPVLQKTPACFNKLCWPLGW